MKFPVTTVSRTRITVLPIVNGQFEVSNLLDVKGPISSSEAFIPSHQPNIQYPRLLEIFESQSPSYGGLILTALAGTSCAELLSALTTKFPSTLLPIWFFTYLLNTVSSWVPYVACYLATSEWRGLEKIFSLPWSFFYVMDLLFLFNFKTLLKDVPKEKMKGFTFHWVIANFFHALLFLTFQSDEWDTSMIQAIIAVIATYFRLNLSRMLSTEGGSKAAGRMTIFHGLLLGQAAVRMVFSQITAIENISNTVTLVCLGVLCAMPSGLAFAAVFPELARMLWMKVKKMTGFYNDDDETISKQNKSEPLHETNGRKEE